MHACEGLRPRRLYGRLQADIIRRQLPWIARVGAQGYHSATEVRGCMDHLVYVLLYSEEQEFIAINHPCVLPSTIHT